MFTDEDLAQYAPEPPKPQVAWSTSRSELKYPSEPPGGGSWAQYFASMRQSSLPDEAEEEESEPEIIITKPAEFVESGWPRAVSPYVKLLQEHGWRYAVGHAESIVPAVWYKDRSRGVRYPEKHQETWWIDAVRDGIRIRVNWCYRDGKPDQTRGGRTSNDKFGLYTDAEMKELITE